MSYWTSEIAGKVKEILIINPQQCGPEPQIFAVGKRRKRARAGKRACFAPGRGRMRIFCMRRKCSRSAAPGGGRFGALIGVVSAGISGGVLIRAGAGTPGGSGRDGARADVARWPRKAESRKEPGAASGRELSARGNLEPVLSGLSKRGQGRKGGAAGTGRSEGRPGPGGTARGLPKRAAASIVVLRHDFCFILHTERFFRRAANFGVMRRPACLNAKRYVFPRG